MSRAINRCMFFLLLCVLGFSCSAHAQVSGPPSANCHITDGTFTTCSNGQTEWSDVTPLAFPASNSYLYVNQDAGHTFLYLMYDLPIRTTPLGPPDSVHINFYTVETQSGAPALVLYDIFIFGNGQMQVLQNGQPTPAGRIVGAVGFGTSRNSSTPHVMAELQVPLSVGPPGTYSPKPQFWGASLPTNPPNCPKQPGKIDDCNKQAVETLSKLEAVWYAAQLAAAATCTLVTDFGCAPAEPIMVDEANIEAASGLLLHKFTRNDPPGFDITILPDPNFTVIAESPLYSLSIPMPGLTPQETAAFTALFANLEQTIAVEQAGIISIARAEGALAAGNTFWVFRQTQAAQNMGVQLGKLLGALPGLHANLASAFQAAGSQFTFTSNDVLAAQSSVNPSSPPSELQNEFALAQQLLPQLGLTSAEQVAIVQSLLSVDPQAAATLGVGAFPASLIDPAYDAALRQLASALTSVPIITGVSPAPLIAPTTPGTFFSGTVAITGQNLQGGSLTTDGPLVLLGGQSAATVDATGTTISQPYTIGCCAPFARETFNFFVNTPNGVASIQDSIALSAVNPTIFSDYGPGMTFSNAPGANGWCVSGPNTLNCGPDNVRWVASPFTPGGTFTLTQVDLALLAFTGTNGAVIELVNSENGLPGPTVLESWTVTNLSSGNLTLASSGGVTLQSGTKYWLVVMPLADDTLDVWRDEPTQLLTGTLACAGPPNSIGNGCTTLNGASWNSVGALTAFDVLGISPAGPFAAPVTSATAAVVEANANGDTVANLRGLAPADAPTLQDQIEMIVQYSVIQNPSTDVTQLTTQLVDSLPSTILPPSQAADIIKAVTKQVVVPPDKIPPITTATASPGPNANGWNNTNVTVAFNSTDNEPNGTGVKQITITLSGAQSGSVVIPGGTGSVQITTEGFTSVSYFGTDNAGNQEVPKTLTVKIDETPPVISGMPAGGCTLWPPNHQFVQVATVTASDALSGLAPATFKVSGASNEPIASTDPVAPDILVTQTSPATFAVQLRAERLGTGTGRVYTLNASASDFAGNTATSTATCTVPHDQGKQ